MVRLNGFDSGFVANMEDSWGFRVRFDDGSSIAVSDMLTFLPPSAVTTKYQTRTRSSGWFAEE